MTTALDRRISALEAGRAAVPVSLSPDKIQAAARLYASSLDDPPPPDPRAEAYWSSTPLHQIAADYTAMLSGAPAPWL